MISSIFTFCTFILGKKLIIKNTYILANIPCKNFPITYFFIDKSVFATILETCNNIDIPPNPSKKQKL